MTASERMKNRRAVEHAIAQQHLEGLVVPPETVRDLERIAKGEMTVADALLAARSRFVHAEIRQ